ncbi:MAG: hypothetical protein JXN62_13020 [Bacteroidales bacterium]|nr:hypothetical protein [Bacteroidales bacterium]
MIKYFWQLPQTLLALILLMIYKYDDRFTYNGKTVYVSKNFPGGVSLGEIIIVRSKYSKTIKHEYGHSKQSMCFGWLYLIIIGIPSLTFNIMTRIGTLKPETYYNRFPENWADKLGNVKR